MAITAEVRGDHASAEALYADALESGMCCWVVEQTELHLARARMAGHLGTAPSVHVEAAAKRVAGWPGPHHDYVESMLKGPRPAVSAPNALTPREREVALLVERGLTNGGIADELFISTKTASVHVSNILAKLAMTSRTEIAAWAARGGLDGPV